MKCITYFGCSSLWLPSWKLNVLKCHNSILHNFFFLIKAQIYISVITPYRSQSLVHVRPLFIFYGFHVHTPLAIYNSKGSCHVKLSIINYFLHIHIKVQREIMFHIKQYTTEYIPAEAYDVSRVRIYILYWTSDL